MQRKVGDRSWRGAVETGPDAPAEEDMSPWGTAERGIGRGCCTLFAGERRGAGRAQAEWESGEDGTVGGGTARRRAVGKTIWRMSGADVV